MNPIRSNIVHVFQEFCRVNNIDYRTGWNLLYQEYGERYHIYPELLYTSVYDKLDMLEMYEELAGTLTKMWNLLKELNDE
jgi:hypothetical protein